MPKYRYTGEPTAISLPVETEGELAQDIQLVPHSEVELPADLPYVQRLVQKGLLELLPEPTRKALKEADS